MLPCSSTSASIVVCTGLVYHRGTRDGPQNTGVKLRSSIMLGFVSFNSLFDGPSLRDANAAARSTDLPVFADA